MSRFTLFATFLRFPVGLSCRLCKFAFKPQSSVLEIFIFIFIHIYFHFHTILDLILIPIPGKTILFKILYFSIFGKAQLKLICPTCHTHCDGGINCVRFFIRVSLFVISPSVKTLQGKAGQATASGGAILTTMWRFFIVDFPRFRAEWLCQSRFNRVGGRPKRVSFMLDRPSPAPSPSSSTTELASVGTAAAAQQQPRPPISVDIVVFLTSDTTMTFEVEVIAGRSQRFYDINADKLQNLEKVFLSHCHAKSLSIRVKNLGASRNKPIHTVNLSSFRCLKDLTRLEIEMSDAAAIQCDNPFLFRLNHLSLSKCQMTTYDFGILMNCLAGTLESLELTQVSLVDSQCSQNVATLLGEMGRLYNLKSLKLDRTWSEFQKDAIRFTCPRLICLSLLKVNFEDLFSSALRTFTSTLMALVVTIEGRDYRITDVDALLHKFHEFAAKSYSSVKFGFKKRLRPKATKPGTDAKTEFSFVLGWPRIEPSDTADDVSERVDEIFAFESLKVYVPARHHRVRSTPSPASSSGSGSPVTYESESFVTALETMGPSVEISAA